MALPDLIEIVPLTAPVKAEITVPGSKSITNRALILAALADGEVVLKGALWSEDTQIMVECLKELGFVVNVATDPDEVCNRTITVVGESGLVPAGGTETQPLELFVGNAGTAARFLAPFLCLGSGVYRLHGVKRMHERPQAALFAAIRELGYRIEAENENDKLPARIYGTGPKKGKCRVSIEESSQFASALLLSAGVGGWRVEIAGENEDESPYVAMTTKLMAAFPRKGGVFQIEPDASGGSYFWAAAPITNSIQTPLPYLPINKSNISDNWTDIAKRIRVNNWPNTGWQIDERFEVFSIMGLKFRVPHNISKRSEELEKLAQTQDSETAEEICRKIISSSKGEDEVSRSRDLGDSIMTAIAGTPLTYWSGKEGFVKFTDLGRLRVQECERVVALRTELTKCGARVIEEGDTLTVYRANKGELHGAEIETYNDHRMAMCFAVLGLKVPGIKIKNPACVKKTFPNFFQKLAAQPPHGLGATILNAKTGKKLTHEELFAD